MLLCAAVLLLSSACGAGPAADDRAAGPPDAGETSDAARVFTGGKVRESGAVLLRLGGRPYDGSEPTPQAGIAGKLVIGEGRCLRLEYGSSEHLPIWPPGYSLSAKGGEMRVLDHRDRVVAGVGEWVTMTGGETRRGEAGPGYWETRRELGVPEACKGPFWGVVPPVRVLEEDPPRREGASGARPDR